MDADALVEVLDAAGIRFRGQARRNLSISCPFAEWRSPPHASGEDRSPSLSIKVNPMGSSAYFCWCCEARGTLVGMLEWLNRLRGGGLDTAIELARQKERDAHGNVVAAVKSGLFDQPQGKVSAVETPLDLIRSFVGTVPKYALDRGLTLDTCRAWYLGLDESSMFVRKFGGPRLVFPVLNEEGKLVGAQGRIVGAPDKGRGGKYINYDFEKSHYLYGEHVAAKVVRESDRKAFILTEGPMDVCMTWQHGVAWIGATMGKTVSDEQKSKILSWGTRIVYMGYDADAAGNIAVDKARKILAGRVLLYRLALPDGKDLGDLTSREDLEAAIRGARPDH